jgi:hypothetical protein
VARWQVRAVEESAKRSKTGQKGAGSSPSSGLVLRPSSTEASRIRHGMRLARHWRAGSLRAQNRCSEVLHDGQVGTASWRCGCVRA